MKNKITLIVMIMIGISEFAIAVPSCAPPIIMQQPNNTSTCAGQNVFFAILANGNSLTYQWQVDQGSGFADVTSGAVYFGATENVLTVTNIPLPFNGNQYRCVITDSCSNITTTNAATLFISLPPIVNANSVTIVSGETAVLTATGATNYVWHIGGMMGDTTNPISLTPITTTTYTVTGTTNGCSSTTTATVTVNQPSIIGATGATGPTGATGVTGATGFNGLIGTTGNNGIDGINGNNGVTGATGATGADGTNGAKGIDGTNGTNGVDGLVGATGADGINGADGANGTNGLNGATGATGADGALSAWGKAGTSGTNPATDFVGTTDAAPLVFRTNNIERLRILPSGSIGMGTTTPVAIGKVFQISANDAGGTSMFLENSGAGGKNWRMLSTGTGNTGGAGTLMIVNHTDDPANPKFMITASGNIGIGTATPNAIGKTLHIASTSTGGTSLFLENTKSWRMLSTGSGNTGGGGNLMIVNHSDDAANPKFTISAAGNVGVGTAAPTAKLEVNGNVKVSGNVRSSGFVFDVAPPLEVNPCFHLMVYNPTGNLTQFTQLDVTAMETIADLHFDPCTITTPIVPFTWNTFGNYVNANNRFIGTTSNFDFNIRTNNVQRLVVKKDGKVQIGTQTITSGPNTDYKLSVDGKIVAKEIYVIAPSNGWADYVFASDYKLTSLGEVEKYYKKNKHLSEIPSEKEVTENGVNVGVMNKLLLKKIEELTLYLIEQNKRIETLEKK